MHPIRIAETAMDRRQFLVAGAAGATTLITPLAARAELPANPDVVVVGAGAAGLAAARTLIDNGVSVALIEAGNRIGGRAYTETDTFGVPFDHGAHWLHNGSRNPFNAYARQNGFDIYPVPETWRVFAGGREIPEDEQGPLLSTSERFYDDIGEAAEKGMDVSPASVTPDSGPWDNTVAMAIGLPMGKDLDEFSVVDYWNGAGGQNWLCTQGYGAVVAHFGAGIPVSLGTNVTRIRWGGPGVEVETDRGTLSAKAVILTVSTGVLAAGHISFDPGLSVEKQEAFNKISMGLYNCIALQFSEDIFGMGPDGFLLHQIGDERRGFGVLTNASGSGLAYCHMGGSFARQIELDGKAAAVDFVVGKLKEMLGPDEVERTLVKSAVTQWGKNPLTEGSYASAEPGAFPMREVLREPVGNRVFFAGEACSRLLWATVGGARESGADVAREVAAEIA